MAMRGIKGDGNERDLAVGERVVQRSTEFEGLRGVGGTWLRASES